MNTAKLTNSVSTPTPRCTVRQLDPAVAAARRANRASLPARPTKAHTHNGTSCSCGGTTHDHDNMYFRPATQVCTTAADRRRSLPIVMSPSTSSPVISTNVKRQVRQVRLVKKDETVVVKKP